jgi:hypothetical protein
MRPGRSFDDDSSQQAPVRNARAGLSIWIGAAYSLILTAPAIGDPLRLVMPLSCEVGRSCAIQQYVDHDVSPDARDYRCGTLTYDGHNGTDFRLPSMAAQRAGVGVLAAAKGRVLRTRDGMPDAQLSALAKPAASGRECGNGVVISHGDGWETQYCHLAQGSVRVKPGDEVMPGEPIGRVGLSGHTQFPHLHLTLRHDGTVVDPFAYGAAEGSCDGGASLWDPSVRESLTYRERAVLNTGFATGPVTMEQIETGELGASPTLTGAPAVVAFVRAIGLKTGDVQQLSIEGPDGQVIIDHIEKPLEHNKAQTMLFVGKKRPSAGWHSGTYWARYSVVQNGQTVLEQRFSQSF